MSSFALFHRPASRRSGPLSVLRSLIDNWRKRRRLRAMLELDDHILKDIGITRRDVLVVLGRPLSTDPVRQLECRSRARRKQPLPDATRRWLHDPAYTHPKLDDY